ncbi:hypothetical protein RhoFasGS6_05072 [Rhodococcus fascians]|nr:hypothetical protein [Rhodococcus fascians]
MLARAVVASAAMVGLGAGRAEIGVVELPTKKFHPAPIGALVVEHRLLLTVPGLLEAFVAARVVRPRLTGGHPTATDASDGPVDVQDLEHHLEPAAIELDQWLESLGRLSLLGIECLDDLSHEMFPRECDGGEIAPDLPVLVAGE